MTIRIPRTLRTALWRHQQEGLDATARYIAAFDRRNPRAALVHLPTRSGKTAVIASLTRCLESSGPVVVIAPRVGLREQLTRNMRRQTHSLFRQGSHYRAAIPTTPPERLGPLVERLAEYVLRQRVYVCTFGLNAA